MRNLAYIFSSSPYMFYIIKNNLFSSPKVARILCHQFTDFLNYFIICFLFVYARRLSCLYPLIYYISCFSILVEQLILSISTLKSMTNFDMITKKSAWHKWRCTWSVQSKKLPIVIFFYFWYSLEFFVFLCSIGLFS